MQLAIICALLTVAIGLAAKLVLDRVGVRCSITRWEFVVASAVMVAVVIPATVGIGMRVARGNLVRYNETWGGLETGTSHFKTTCHRDGSCEHTYQCDPYQVLETYTVSVGSGKDARTETRTRTVTKYHDCPYVTEEWTFIVHTTLGDYTISSHGFPDSPRIWRAGNNIPGNVARGVPAFWSAAKQRVDSRNPGGVAVRKQYDNYILASQSTILHRYSDEIRQYQRDKLLPNIESGIRDWYYINRLYPVGVQPQGDWTVELSRLNGHLGKELQGDLHVIAIDAAKVNPDKYAMALSAWWQSPQFGKDALSKNGIAVVLGITDGRVVWARGFTGMPVGNESLLADVRRSTPGAAFNPTEVLPRLRAALWGEHKFRRVCMTCREEGGIGYKYLQNEIQPTSTQKTLIAIICMMFALAAWGICIVVGVPSIRRDN